MPQIVPKITIFLVFMNKTQILLFALRKQRRLSATDDIDHTPD